MDGDRYSGWSTTDCGRLDIDLWQSNDCTWRCLQQKQVTVNFSVKIEIIREDDVTSVVYFKIVLMTFRIRIWIRFSGTSKEEPRILNHIRDMENRRLSLVTNIFQFLVDAQHQTML